MDECSRQGFDAATSQLALDEDGPIRLIIARLKNNPNAEVGGMDASNEPKVIMPYPDRVGKIVELTASSLIIDFRKQKPSL